MELLTAILHSCRDGLAEPPPSSKKRNANVAEKSKTGTNQSSHMSTGVHMVPADVIPTKSKKHFVQPDRRLEQLESLHERTNVKSSLQLPDGKRLKLDASDQPNRKRKPVPDFDIEFTDLNDEKISNMHRIADDIDADETDLPEPYDLLNPIPISGSKCTPSSDTNYSNSETDALIRDLPLHDDLKGSPAIRTKNNTAIKKDRSSESWYSQRLPSTLALSPTLKRKLATSDVNPEAKRSRLQTGEVERKSPSPISHSYHDKVCLCLL